MSEASAAVEIIPATDNVSRLLFEPGMRPDNEIYWVAVFMFKSEHGMRESLVWRKYAPEMPDVHAIGCNKQFEDRKKAKNSTYFGAVTALVDNILKLKSKNGIGFKIEHAPEEGVHHAHILFMDNSTKADRTELKVLLQKNFDGFEEHSCPGTNGVEGTGQAPQPS